ncbi:MAG: hypothetical protein M1814_001571 [Vezdaea aestivalis]|nr:MAG: hypothetical protein M1814_001571 [Vezdaea aestivalis]
MADYEDRNRGHRGYNNRKRRFRGDEDDYNHRPQRRRYEEPDHIKLRKQLIGLGESPLTRPEDEVVQIAKLVADKSSDETVKETFVNVVTAIIIEQPLKIPFIAAAVLAANELGSSFVPQIFERVSVLGKTALEAGSWRKVKLVLRFLACLQGVFEGDGIFPLLDDLFDKAVELQTSSSEDALGLEIVKIIQLTLPYILSASSPGNTALAIALLEKTDVIAFTPHPLEAIVNPYPGNGDEEPSSFISLIQKQLQDEANNGWPLFCIPRPWKGIARLKSENADLENPTDPPTHQFPSLPLPAVMNPGPDPLFPDIFFSVYADQSVETVPPSSSIASCLLRDSVTDTINLLDFNRNATAKFLIDVDSYFAPGTFVKRATQFDKLKDVPEGMSRWKPEDVAVDAVFSQLFQLPSPEHKLVYYHSVLTEMCQVAPAAIAPSLGRAIRFLYKNVEAMDLELEYRFMDWFAHHLSNFGFTWKWVEWVDDVALPDLHPKKAFMAGALEKEVRLSFSKRIRDTLPEPYQPLIPAEKDQDVPPFKYKMLESPVSPLALELRLALQKKAPDEEISPLIDQITTLAGTSAATDAYITSLLSIGAKSLSHVLSCIERSKSRLLPLGASGPETQAQIINSVMHFWRMQPGVGTNIIDKLLNYTILSPAAVLDWAVAPERDDKRLGLPHVFEAVFSTLRKVTNRVKQIVAARDEPDMRTEQIEILQESLTREWAEEKRLFELLDRGLAALKDKDDGSGSGRVWVRRWEGVFKRVAQVERQAVEERVANVPEGVQGESNGIGVAVLGTDGLGPEDDDVV